MLLLAPRAELSRSQQVPRDMVFVLDTSGSMRGKRMAQAQSALKYCIDKLSPHDRKWPPGHRYDPSQYGTDSISIDSISIRCDTAVARCSAL